MKSRALLAAEIEDLSEFCNGEMVAKFGRVVDLEVLEQVTVNRQLEELKERLHLAELECEQELLQWQVRFRIPIRYQSMITVIYLS